MVIGGGGGGGAAAAATTNCCSSVRPLPPFKSSSSATLATYSQAQVQQFIGCAQWRGRKRRAGIYGSGHLHYQPLITYKVALTINNSLELELNKIKDNSKKWDWRGHSINYFLQLSPQQPQRPPLLLVHGFGASIPHWRRNIGILSQSYTVYAIDLLGFGSSEKPAGFTYTMELWAQLILDFITEIIQKPTVLIGNSVGSLACVIAASESTNDLVKGLVLLNCAGGMNNKAIVDDWRIKLLLPLLWLIDFLLKQPSIASAIFERVKQRENLRNILLSVYGNKEAVDEILVEIIKAPAEEEGALEAFVSIVTGPPGPNPVEVMPKISIPVLILWGDQDPFTPLDGPVGRYFSSLPSQLPNINLSVLKGVGHCPHDDRPDLVHEKLLPWLAALPVS